MYDVKKLTEELTRDEGIRLNAYKDSVGLWTIGVGHLLGTEKRMDKITVEEANALLMADILQAEKTLSSVIPYWRDDLNDVRQRALLNMSFNLGYRLAQFSRFRALLQLQKYEEAAKEMLDSKWAKQVGARATRLSEMIAKGI